MVTRLGKSEIAVVYATYKQGLWGDRPMDNYIEMLYSLQADSAGFLEIGHETGRDWGFYGIPIDEAVDRIRQITNLASAHEFDAAYEALERLWNDLGERYKKIITAAAKRKSRGMRWHPHTGRRRVYGGADYSTFSGNEFVDMIL